MGPVRGGVYNLFEPVTALAASVLWLNQSFHPAEIGGASAILAGIAILTIAKEKDKNTNTNTIKEDIGNEFKGN